jgi:hypothetical protein
LSCAEATEVACSAAGCAAVMGRNYATEGGLATLKTPSWPGKSAKRVFALDVPAVQVFHCAQKSGTWVPVQDQRC